MAPPLPTSPRRLRSPITPSHMSPGFTLERIENASDRHLTFCKRRLALLKRARKLSVLCDAEVALLGFSGSGSFFEYEGSRSMRELIQAYFDAHAGNPFRPLAHSSSQESQDEIERLKEEGPRIEQENRTGDSGDMEEVEPVSIEELEKLETELECELNRVHRTQDRLIAERRKQLARKEQELLRENERLRNELKQSESGAVEEAAPSTCSSQNDEDTMSMVLSVDSRGGLVCPASNA